MQYYRETTLAVLKHLKSDQNKGLSDAEVKDRQKQFGENVLPKTRAKMTTIKIFLNQWKSPLLFILLIAGLISGLLGEYTDMTVILLTAGINAFIGFIQENKANRALEKLQEMVEYKAIVLRDGERKIIKSTEIVPGDILYLEAGDKIQADGRVLSSIDFDVLEAALTGESEEIKKEDVVMKKEVVVADRTNMVYRGTTAVNGHSTIVVTSIGGETQIGKIATMVRDIEEEETPLQAQLRSLSKKIGMVVLVISILIFLLGIFVSEETTLFEMFETSVAIAVAAIPEGLIISLTVILAIGMQFMLKRKGLVRRLVSAETLGSVSVICTDKTGTLTEGRMNVTRLITKVDELDFDEIKTLKPEKEARHSEALLALRIGVLCNNASPKQSDGKEVEFLGDTTEIALAEMAARVGLYKPHLEEDAVRVDEIPFDSKKKYMATLHHIDHDAFVYTKGAPEVILKRCKQFQEGGKIKNLTEKQKRWFEGQVEGLTSRGLRVLVLAYKKEDYKKHELEEADVDGLILVGIVALSDPIRSEVKETIGIAKTAGIRVIMVTGDHAKTAEAIGKEIGLSVDDDSILNGEKLQTMSDESLRQAVKKISIFARVDPRDKIRIVEALKKNGEVVAMTGDGVNDAPALKGADVGVAVGSGTDVAKEIADLVILDNRFSTIVAAVEQGRTIYQNIKKIVLYLLSGSFAEVVLITGSLVAGLPLAVLPTQILWVNIIEDSFPNMALAFDKGDRENMKEPPRKKGMRLIDKEMKIMILIISVVSNLVLFGLFLYFLRTTGDIALTRTLMFIGLGIDSLLYIYSVRSMRHMIWEMNPFNNKYLTVAVIFGFVMLIAAVYVPTLQTLLRTVAIGWKEWGIMLSFGLLNVLLIEIVKGVFLVRKARKKEYSTSTS